MKVQKKVATRADGMARLAEFLPRAGRDYAERRNYVEGPTHANVSGLSPWVQKRLVLEEELVEAARRRWGFPGAEKFIQEAYWRTYWKGWLEQRPQVWTRWREAVPRLRDELSGGRREAWAAACAGRTDIECLNRWARELVETGWLHNHARMWFASLWIFTLRLPWELGAAFFFEHLLDGVAASNTLSWRWVAGLQTPGKTYLARPDNIVKYSGIDQTDSGRGLATEAFAITEDPIPREALPERAGDWRAALSVMAGGTEMGRRAGLWLHAEDLVPEVGGVADAPVAGVFAGWPSGLETRAGWSAGVASWTRGALGDGAARAGGHFGCAVDAGEGVEGVDFAKRLTEWARRERLGRVLAHEPQVGPWREQARAAETALEAAGVRMVWIRRRWDAEWWPRATRGYFPFWEEVKRKEA